MYAGPHEGLAIGQRGVMTNGSSQVMANFFVSVAEAELVPEPGTALDARFQFVDTFFTGPAAAIECSSEQQPERF